MKYKLNLGSLDGDKFLNLPLSLDFNSGVNEELVNRVFVDDKVEDSINTIIDYERARFSPILSNGNFVKDLYYNLNFLSNGSIKEPTYFSDIGFVDDDIKFRRNRFKKSFVRLNFYDSDKTTNQNLVTSITIYPRVSMDTTTDGNFNNLQLPANSFPLRFILKNPITQPEGFSEGFFLYYFKNTELPTNLYMRAEFNNASTGKITRFLTTKEVLPINEMVGKLHTKYTLSRDNTGFFYRIPDEDNVDESETRLTVNLYEIQVK